MTGAERGYLLLCSQLGNGERKPLTGPQLRGLARRMRAMKRPEEDRPLSPNDLIALGYSREEALRMVSLLSEEALLDYYLEKARRMGCLPITRVSPRYPAVLKERMGDDAPGCLWARGDLSLLESPMISLVGSRDLEKENQAFAREAGSQAAKQGYVLVSGNARGADKTAQNAALEAGGGIISILADSLAAHSPRGSRLYLSLEGFDAPFSVPRALQRNAVIHALGEKVLVAQCALERGGTWAGTELNLRKGYSPVFCFADGSESCSRLAALGADWISREQLQDLRGLRPDKLFFL